MGFQPLQTPNSQIVEKLIISRGCVENIESLKRNSYRNTLRIPERCISALRHRTRLQRVPDGSFAQSGTAPSVLERVRHLSVACEGEEVPVARSLLSSA